MKPSGSYHSSKKNLKKYTNKDPRHGMSERARPFVAAACRAPGPSSPAGDGGKNYFASTFDAVKLEARGKATAGRDSLHQSRECCGAGSSSVPCRSAILERRRRKPYIL